MPTAPPQDEHGRAAQTAGPSEFALVSWDAMADDRWSTLAALGHSRLVVVALPRGAAVDPIALLAAGARAVVAEEGSPEELAMARTVALAGGSYLSPTVFGRRGTGAGARRSTGVLSPRELETLRCLVDGLTHRQVARRLGVTEQTVNTYAKRLRRKLGAGNAAELTQRALELGYIRTS